MVTGENMGDIEVERVWNELWRPIVCKRGQIDVEQVKKELYDYSVFMDNAARVYCHVTGGAISKINTDPDVVIAVADDYMDELIQQERAI